MDPDEVVRRVHQQAATHAAETKDAYAQQAVTNRQNLQVYVEALRASIPSLVAHDPGPPVRRGHLLALTTPHDRAGRRQGRADDAMHAAGWLLLTWTVEDPMSGRDGGGSRPRTEALYLLVDGRFALANSAHSPHAPEIVRPITTDEQVLGIIFNEAGDLRRFREFVERAHQIFEVAGLTPPASPEAGLAGRPSVAERMRDVNLELHKPRVLPRPHPPELS